MLRVPDGIDLQRSNISCGTVPLTYYEAIIFVSRSAASFGLGLYEETRQDCQLALGRPFIDYQLSVQDFTLLYM